MSQPVLADGRPAPLDRSEMQSNPMFAQSDESGQADSPGIAGVAMGTLNSAFSNPMFSADDSPSESPGVDVAEKGDSGQEEEEQVIPALSPFLLLSSSAPGQQLALTALAVLLLFFRIHRSRIVPRTMPSMCRGRSQLQR